MRPVASFTVVAAVLMGALTLDAKDQPVCGFDRATGRPFNPQPDKFTHCILPSTPPSTTPPERPGMIRVLEASGEITLMPADGWLPPENTSPRREPIPDVLHARPGASFDIGTGTIMRTGRNAQATVAMGNYRVVIREETEVMVERYLRRPLDKSDLIFKIYKGAIRLKLIDIRNPGKTCYLDGLWCSIRVVNPVGHFTPIGTDVELYTAEDLSGFVKLYEGSGIFEPHDTDREILLAAGQMLTFDADGRVTGPFPIR